MPEPLNKVLEPVSVLHLDMPNDELDAHLRNESYHSTFIRHGSVGAVEDTGVIGPIVWNMHKQRLQHGTYCLVLVFHLFYLSFRCECR